MRPGSSTRFCEELSFPQRERSRRFAAPSIPSPCPLPRHSRMRARNRPYRLGLLWIDLTPARSSQVPSFSWGPATSRGGNGQVSRVQVRFLECMPQSKWTPADLQGQTIYPPSVLASANLKASPSASRPVTGLCQLSGNCESPYGLHSTLRTLRGGCSAVRRHPLGPAGSDHRHVSLYFMRLS